ncbi:MAG: alkaline phosphatase family protein [Deltaproteobacteria bacterium]|nr:alkaline phosphatase family protein [Nannocystaceae bacterium]
MAARLSVAQIVPSATARACILALLCALGVGIAGWLGTHYIPRLPNHQGEFLVDVVDPVRVPMHSPPQRVTLVVVDGLREDAARTMATVARLAEFGQCRTTDAGPYTVSRPVYSLLSTGLEVDRSGARNNEETSPLRAESVWDVAAEAGLEVAVVSHLPWWCQLFPAAFAQSIEVPEHESVFSAAAQVRADLMVIHPIDVDSAGHAAGAASREYRAAVERVDAQALAWLDTVDLQREVVVLTADHGHVDAGGHGGHQPEVRRVLACFAGPSIAARTDAAAIDSRIIGPAIAVASGLRFPKNMRALDDDLDSLWTIFSGLDARYVEDRQRSIDDFRRRNAEALANWLGEGTAVSWDALAEEARQARRGRIVVLMVLLAALVAVGLRISGRGMLDAARSLLWVAGVCVATAVVWVVLRGSFDYTSMNERLPFLRASVPTCIGVALVAAWLHARVFRDPARWATDQAMVTLVAVGLAGAHVLAFGWPLAFPVPHRTVLFFPFLAATFGVVHGGLGIIAALRWARWTQVSRAVALR